MIEQTPVDDNEPKPDDKPAPAAPDVGTNIKGDGPADGFGLSGSGGGARLGGSGSQGGGSRWGWWAGEAQAAIRDVLGRDPRTRSASFAASKIAVTPMIGMNDATSEIFTTADVDTLSSYAVSNGLAGVHYWSLDRDTPCSDTYASPTCNSISSTTPLEYANRFLSDLGD